MLARSVASAVQLLRQWILRFRGCPVPEKEAPLPNLALQLPAEPPEASFAIMSISREGSFDIKIIEECEQ